MEDYSVICIWKSPVSNDLFKNHTALHDDQYVRDETVMTICDEGDHLEDVLHVNKCCLRHTPRHKAIEGVLAGHNVTMTGDVVQIPSEVHDDADAACTDDLLNHCSDMPYYSCCIVNLDATLTKLVTKELRTSATFQQGFIQYIYSQCKSLNGSCVHHKSRISRAVNFTARPHALIIRLTWTAKLLLDYKWFVDY